MTTLAPPPPSVFLFREPPPTGVVVPPSVVALVSEFFLYGLSGNDGCDWSGYVSGVCGLSVFRLGLLRYRLLNCDADDAVVGYMLAVVDDVEALMGAVSRPGLRAALGYPPGPLSETRVSALTLWVLVDAVCKSRDDTLLKKVASELCGVTARTAVGGQVRGHVMNRVSGCLPEGSLLLWM